MVPCECIAVARKSLSPSLAHSRDAGGPSLVTGHAARRLDANDSLMVRREGPTMPATARQHKAQLPLLRPRHVPQPSQHKMRRAATCCCVLVRGRANSWLVKAYSSRILGLVGAHKFIFSSLAGQRMTD